MNIDSTVLQEVLLGVGLFTAVVLILVFVILVARSKLVATGNVAIVVNDERESSRRLADILSRLKMIPAYLEKELEALTTPVRRWRDVEVERAGELPELFQTVLNWALETGFAYSDELAAAIETANHTLRSYSSALERMQTTEQFCIGRQQMEALIDIKRLGKSPEELRRMAADYMADEESGATPVPVPPAGSPSPGHGNKLLLQINMARFSKARGKTDCAAAS